MAKLIKTLNKDDIFEKYKNTPLEKLIEYHNFKEKFDNHDKAEILIGTCMDNRVQINVPINFAYVLRAPGVNLRYNEFGISYAIAIGEVKYAALIGHSDCGMVNLVSKREKFIEGLAKNGGIDRKKAEEQFEKFSPLMEIKNETEFVLEESERLSQKYSGILFAPFIYMLEDNLLYQIATES